VKNYALTLLKKYLKKPMDGLYTKILAITAVSESQFLGNIILNPILGLSKFLKIRKIPFKLRRIISLSFPTNPLSSQNMPTIDIAIPVGEKDLETIWLTINGAKKNVQNPIGKIYLVTPSRFVTQLQFRFPDCVVSSDESILGPVIIDKVKTLVPERRRGWIIQQLIKLRIAITSSQIATLILDADTILLKPRVWLDSKGVQIICIGTDFHSPYKNHQRKMFGSGQLLGFVTHHQLMKKKILLEIFGDTDEGLIKWLSFADFNNISAISEYDTYGEYLVSTRPLEFIFTKWNNHEVKINLYPEIDFKDIEEDFSQYCSISSHWHL
jgi:hypothetical protein